MKGQSLRVVAFTTLLAFSVVSTGCVGQFAAFNQLAKWNQKASPEKWVNELIFVAINIIPVYFFVWLGDILIFNSIEFWTGKNPILTDSDQQKTVEFGDRKAVQSFHQTESMRSMEVKYYAGDRLEGTLTLSQRTGSPEYRGLTVAADGTADEFTILVREAGLTLTRISPEGFETVQIIEGAALRSLTEKVAMALDRPKTTGQKLAAAY